LFDKVSVIVPTDAKPTYSEATLRLRENLPDAFVELREKRFDPQLDDTRLKSLSAALDEIAAAPRNGDDAPWHHQETTALHDAKITYRIAELLRERGLIYGEHGQFVHTDTRVAYLILSLLADRYGTQRGLWTVTDDPFGYSVNVLGLCDYDAEAAAENSLATAILTATVPDEIEELSPKVYADLRKRYEPSRATLHAAIREISRDARLRVIKNKDELKERIDKCTASFVKEVDEVKVSKSGFTIQNWTSFGIGTIVDVAATALSLFTPFAGLPLTAGWRLIEMARTKPSESAVLDAQRLVAGLRTEIVEPSLFRRLQRRRLEKKAK